MNRTTGLRQRSNRTKKLIIAGAMAAAVGGFGVAITLPANAASGRFCATKSCKGTPSPNGKKGTPKDKGPAETILSLTGQGDSPSEAKIDLKDACGKFNGKVIRITRTYTEADDLGQVFYVDGDCSVGENQLR